MSLRSETKLARYAFFLSIILLLSFIQQHASDAFNPLPKQAQRSRGNFVKKSSLNLESSTWGTLSEATVVSPASGRQCNALDGIARTNSNGIFESFTSMIGAGGKETTEEHILVVVMSQLGDFDSAEYAELLACVQEDLRRAKITLRVLGIGDVASAKRFAAFSGLDLDSIRVDPTGKIHRALGLHRGPNWDVPSFIPEGFLDWFSDYVGAKTDETRDSKAIFRSWLNYMAMCAGIAAPDTLPEIFRGYVGDKKSPERIRSTEIVTVGGASDPFIKITGTTDVKLGPFNYQQAWKEESGYQRPLELATVRLRIMVEVLSNFGEYVPDQRHLDLRGATYLFRKDDKQAVSLVYQHIDTGVLSYSKTMGRPLSFLESFIGEKAFNPLELGDVSRD